MHQNWHFPDRPSIDFAAIQLSQLNKNHHLDKLFEISQPEYNQGTDIFEFMLNTGPFPTRAHFERYLDSLLRDPHRIAYAVYSKRFSQLVGTASIMNIENNHGVAELGAIWYCRKAQRTEINTQTIFALLVYLLDDLGYRRIEWKCNNAHQRSKTAALRLGFTFEGVFRNHRVDKGKNRDTAWYSIIDSEWSAVKFHIEQTLLKADQPK